MFEWESHVITCPSRVPVPIEVPPEFMHRLVTPASWSSSPWKQGRWSASRPRCRASPNPHWTRTRKFCGKFLWCCLCQVRTLPFTTAGCIGFRLHLCVSLDWTLGGGVSSVTLTTKMRNVSLQNGGGGYNNITVGRRPPRKSFSFNKTFAPPQPCNGPPTPGSTSPHLTPSHYDLPPPHSLFWCILNKLFGTVLVTLYSMWKPFFPAEQSHSWKIKLHSSFFSTWTESEISKSNNLLDIIRFW